MKKTTLKPLGSIIIIFLFLILLNQSLATALSDSYVTIASSGIIREPMNMKKHVIVYEGWLSDEDSLFVSSHFNEVVTILEARSVVSKIKALNPNIMVWFYRDIMAMFPSYTDWQEVNSHEDWFLHDINGNRLVNEQFGWYAMDVGKVGWRSHYANFVKDKLDIYPVFDGLFADDVYGTFWGDLWTAPQSDIPQEIMQRWRNDMLGMIQYVKAIVGNKLLILNTDEWTGEFLRYADGIMLEGFIHASWWGLDYFGLSSFNPLYHVNILHNLSNTGKYFLAHSGARIPDNPTQTDLKKAHDIVIYCYTSFLLGVNGEKATFGFNKIDSEDGSRGYYPEFDVRLGDPINAYYKLGSVYSRDFNIGKVLVNPTTSSYAVNLGSEYKTLDGQVVSSVTLSAHSGIILLKP